MADFDSSLPIRTQEAGDVISKICDATVESQQLKVNADGSIDVNSSLPAGTKVIITDGTDDLAINADGSINSVVTATDLDVRDLVAASDSVAAHLFDEAGVAFSSSNPLPVEFFENQTEVFDFSTGTAIAKNASHTHTFAAPANFKLKDAYISGSGKLRAELRIATVVVAVGFNSTANPQISWRFQKGLNASSVNVEVVIENLDNSAQNVYSTLIGIN